MKDLLKKAMEKAGQVAGLLLPITPALFLGIVLFMGAAGHERPDSSASLSVKAANVDWDSLRLQKADRKEPDEAQEAEPDPSRETSNEQKASKEGGLAIADGTYQGSAQGYGGQITVNVNVEGGTIKSIDIVSAPGETDPYFTKAKDVIDKIIAAQSTKVDAISGATFSSTGIIGAVENALYGKSDQANPSAAKTTSEKKSAPSVSTVKETSSYKDGVYTGSAKGFGGQIKVQVTISKGKISSIKILSAQGETASYFDRAKSLTGKIVEKQSTNVDTVSGATYSSAGIIKAVRNALKKAKKSTGTKKKTQKKKSNKKNKKKSGSSKSTEQKDSTTKQYTPSLDLSDASYEDGTYTGTGQGFEGKIEVEVVIKSGKIDQINILSKEDDDPYFGNAKAGILPAVIEKQSTAVDIVTGASYSSRGILSAIDEALSKAKKSGNTASDDKSGAEGSTEETNQKETGNPADEGDNDTQDDQKVYVYKDGTYPVTVTVMDIDEDFLDYDISMDVVIKDDKIIEVNNIKGDEGCDANNQFFLNKAIEGTISHIIDQGNADVDTVSGATCSSRAIIEACKEALSRAKQ